MKIIFTYSYCIPTDSSRPVWWLSRQKFFVAAHPSCIFTTHVMAGMILGLALGNGSGCLWIGVSQGLIHQWCSHQEGGLFLMRRFPFRCCLHSLLYFWNKSGQGGGDKKFKTFVNFINEWPLICTDMRTTLLAPQTNRFYRGRGYKTIETL